MVSFNSEDISNYSVTISSELFRYYMNIKNPAQRENFIQIILMNKFSGKDYRLTDDDTTNNLIDGYYNSCNELKDMLEQLAVGYNIPIPTFKKKVIEILGCYPIEEIMVIIHFWINNFQTVNQNRTANAKYYAYFNNDTLKFDLGFLKTYGNQIIKNPDSVVAKIQQKFNEVKYDN